MDIMKPILHVNVPPPSDGFLYEIKYDGFRVLLHWNKKEVRLMSKNNVDLSHKFPEVIDFCHSVEQKVYQFLPLVLDGELVVLNNKYQANFSLIQSRGRMKHEEKVKNAATLRPASYMCFDLLTVHGKSIRGKKYIKRREMLESFSELFMNHKGKSRVFVIDIFDDPHLIYEKEHLYRAEGIVAKRTISSYKNGKNHRDWLKIKNWRTIYGVLTAYDQSNNYFTVSVFDKEQMVTIGKCKHGLNEEENKTLQTFFIEKGVKDENIYRLSPAICVAIHTLDLYDGELREPEFKEIVPSMEPTDCTMHQLKIDMAMLPNNVDIKKTEKVFWPKIEATKGDLLIYFRQVAPYMLPFLEDKQLTLIRCPDGVDGESFYQKSAPDYAPDFIHSVEQNDKSVIICNRLDGLIWLANHGAIEYHIPFNTIPSSYPNEICFDLDPPSVEQFDYAIIAANLIKKMLDDLKLVSFVKTSGNKGLQIHIPLPKNKMTYEETAVFTKAVAMILTKEYPQLFTIERLKKNRKNRLYIDYVQHGKGKTLIAPYSPRKTETATVATPLFWDEVKEELDPLSFTIQNVVERVYMKGCPFSDYHEIGMRQNMDNILPFIHKK